MTDTPDNIPATKKIEDSWVVNFRGMVESEEAIPQEMEVEYGSSEPFRFASAENTKMYLSDGEEPLCKCGKPATEFIFGLNAYLARCYECSQKGAE